MVRSRLGEICSYSYLPALPGSAWVLLNCILRILCTSVLFLSLNSHPFEVTGSYFLDIVDFYLRPWTSWETLTKSAGCNGSSVRAAPRRFGVRVSKIAFPFVKMKCCPLRPPSAPSAISPEL